VRTAFIETLVEIAAADERVWLVCADIGFSVLEVFAERFPERFLNTGVAEQNMTGVSAGLAMSGKIVFTYSIANFPVMRCLEQIRNDVCYHNLNVKIVAVGGGLAYSAQGYSHHGTEDLAVMRVMPNITVVAPGDPVETRLAVRAIHAHDGPCYLRLGKSREPIVHSSEPEFALGKAIVLSEGDDISLVSTGAMLETTVGAAKELARRGVSASVISMPTVQPPDERAIRLLASKTGHLITVEEHGIGGLGSAVAEVIAESGTACKFRAMHLPREASKLAGSQDYLRAMHGLSVRGIVDCAEALLRSKVEL